MKKQLSHSQQVLLRICRQQHTSPSAFLLLQSWRESIIQQQRSNYVKPSIYLSSQSKDSKQPNESEAPDHESQVNNPDPGSLWGTWVSGKRATQDTQQKTSTQTELQVQKKEFTEREKEYIAPGLSPTTMKLIRGLRKYEEAGGIKFPAPVKANPFAPPTNTHPTNATASNTSASNTSASNADPARPKSMDQIPWQTWPEPGTTSHIKEASAAEEADKKIEEGDLPATKEELVQFILDSPAVAWTLPLAVDAPDKLLPSSTRPISITQSQNFFGRIPLEEDYIKLAASQASQESSSSLEQPHDDTSASSSTSTEPQYNFAAATAGAAAPADAGASSAASAGAAGAAGGDGPISTPPPAGDGNYTSSDPTSNIPRPERDRRPPKPYVTKSTLQFMRSLPAAAPDEAVVKQTKDLIGRFFLSFCLPLWLTSAPLLQLFQVPLYYLDLAAQIHVSYAIVMAAMQGGVHFGVGIMRQSGLNHGPVRTLYCWSMLPAMIAFPCVLLHTVPATSWMFMVTLIWWLLERQLGKTKNLPQWYVRMRAWQCLLTLIPLGATWLAFTVQEQELDVAYAVLEQRAKKEYELRQQIGQSSVKSQ